MFGVQVGFIFWCCISTKQFMYNITFNIRISYIGIIITLVFTISMHVLWLYLFKGIHKHVYIIDQYVCMIYGYCIGIYSGVGRKYIIWALMCDFRCYFNQWFPITYPYHLCKVYVNLMQIYVQSTVICQRLSAGVVFKTRFNLYAVQYLKYVFNIMTIRGVYLLSFSGLGNKTLGRGGATH